jgi:hypothetical protein
MRACCSIWCVSGELSFGRSGSGLSSFDSTDSASQSVMQVLTLIPAALVTDPLADVTVAVVVYAS